MADLGKLESLKKAGESIEKVTRKYSESPGKVLRLSWESPGKVLIVMRDFVFNL